MKSDFSFFDAKMRPLASLLPSEKRLGLRKEDSSIPVMEKVLIMKIINNFVLELNVIKNIVI